MVRAGGGVDWNREWLLPRGVLASTTGAALVDVYRVWDDPDEPDVDFRTVPTAAVELRWPLVRSTRSADHVIEPIAQVVWSEAYGEEGPNEDSQLPEFDETNLFSLNRFPGEDRVETGLRANLGVSYTRQDPSGWSLGATFGQVVRAEPDDEFWSTAPASPAAGPTTSAPSSSTSRPGLTLVNRALFDGARLPAQRVRLRLRRRACRPARRLHLPRGGRLQPATSARSPRPTSSPSMPATGSTRTGSCAASGATTWRRAATCAPAPRSPTATSAPSSTFRSRAAIRHRLICRPRPRSASTCGWRGSARTASGTGRRGSAWPRGT